MCYVTLVSVLIEETKGPKHNKTRLSTQVVFTAANLEIPLTCFVLPSLLALCARR
jgi:hypothetical protein